ncbi:AsnC family protein [Amycolatopsis sp. QT-25]|uniref:AsnC family protein n=1 Tax=Amycolatopsis sp. QT-25 TaxID=3034022 RepID=UPI0023EC33F8|nr:AsnC family protein [Amycolatopsis sp. QT-25]WET77479.1 AsnC family protein [Amycolatopsis sp. QT-25]
MAVTDPVDIRLLAALADLGKVAVHELAAKVGMDPREVAYRLVALSGSGLPLLVGVESDPNGLRAAIAGAPPSWAQQPPQPSQPPQSLQPPPPQRPPGHSGPHNIQGTPSGPYNVQGTPSGAYNVHGTPSGRYPGPPSAPVRQPMAPPRPPAPPQQQFAPPPPAPADPVMSTWGVPQTASWARGDEQQVTAQAAPEGKKGRTGDVLETQGLEGEQLTVQLLEVQDPADYLFSAAGYSLEAGERSVVVHTEITNRGGIPFVSLPDNYLELLTADGKPIGKAPVSLTSRPPHRIGVRPGETLGGHTVYVLPDATRVVAVRWSPRPEPDERTLTWSIDD